ILVQNNTNKNTAAYLRRHHFPRTDAHLKNRRTTGDRRRDGHVGHDVVLTAAGESGEERAGGLNSILRITGEPDHRVLNAFRPQIGSVGGRRCRLCSSIPSFTHGIRKLTDRSAISTGNWLEVML